MNRIIFAILILVVSAGASALRLGVDRSAITLNISGSDAANSLIFESLTGSQGIETYPVCASDIDVYTISSSSSNPIEGGAWAVFCRTYQGDALLFRAWFGGSPSAPKGVCGAPGEGLFWIPEISNNCHEPVVGTGIVAGLNVHNNCGTYERANSHIGISSLEINKLLDYSTACDGRALDYDIPLHYGVIFGIAATNDLYVALQNVQGLDTDVNNDGIADAYQDTSLFQGSNCGITGAENCRTVHEANMPSLTRAQIAAIPQNIHKRWSDLGLPDQNTSSTSDDLTKWCTRSSAFSGARAAMEAKITQSTCGGSVPSFVDNTPNSSAGGNFTYTFPSGFLNPSCESGASACIVEVNSSRHMNNCLKAWQQNTGDNGTWALGYQATSLFWVDGLFFNPRWNFIKIDGYAPTIANAITGRYTFTTEATLIADGLNFQQQQVLDHILQRIQHFMLYDYGVTQADTKFGRTGLYATTDFGSCAAEENIACGGYSLLGITNSCVFQIQDPLP